MLITYFGGERCELTEKVIMKSVETIYRAKSIWIDEINNSFLNDEMKERYLRLVESRLDRLS
jgi:serine/threonine-protein kinase HipA